MENLRGWSDHDGDLDSAFPREELLTWFTAYWLTNTIGSSFETYINAVAPPQFVSTPTVISAFKHDTQPAPREFVARFVNLQQRIEHDSGGHFAA